MNLAFFYDTETTGLPLFATPDEHPDQPHVAQLGGCLIDLDTRKECASIDLVIRPDGWTIPDEAAAIHGITTEYARAVGVPAFLAYSLFLELWAKAEQRIGHNEQFDARILGINLKRHSMFADIDWNAGKAACTLELSTPILKLPPTPKMLRAGRRHYKKANLGEAYQYFTGMPLVGAHSAMVDVRACMAVWFAIADGKVKT